MKKTFALCAVLAACATAFAADDAVETESSYSITVDFPYVTKYVFRGVELSRDSLQPSVELASGDFYAGLWNNTPLRNEHDGDASQEIDLYLGYAPQLTENLKGDFGITWYWYPWLDGNGDDNSVEVFAGLNYTLGNFTPSVYLYRDLDLEVTTAQFALGYSIPLKDLGTSFDLSASVGAVLPDEGEDYCYYSFGVNIPYKLSDSVKLNLGVSYTENDLDGGEDPGVWGTVGITASF